MTYQHAILPAGTELALRVEQEAGQYFCVSYRFTPPGHGHKDDWRAAEHLTQAEAEDVICAVWQGWRDDLEAQGLF